MLFVQDPHVQRALLEQNRERETKEGVLISKVERMEFLASLIRNIDPYEKPTVDEYGELVPPPPPGMSIRIKAVDMYNKMEGDYHTNVNVNHNVSIPDLILSSFVDAQTRNLEDIEAVYYSEVEVKEKATPTVEDLLGL